MKKYVITGGPGIGKTTVIEILASMGYKIVPESARKIIEEEKLKNSDILPWKNLEKFQEQVAKRQLENEAKANGEVIFLDRGLIDGYGYCVRAKVKRPNLIDDSASERYDKIFVLEPLDTYKLDKTRYEEKGEAKKIHEAIIAAYGHFYYKPIFVPVLSPQERVDFILRKINN
jgi:predicted ATPase